MKKFILEQSLLKYFNEPHGKINIEYIYDTYYEVSFEDEFETYFVFETKKALDVLTIFRNKLILKIEEDIPCCWHDFIDFQDIANQMFGTIDDVFEHMASVSMEGNSYDICDTPKL